MEKDRFLAYLTEHYNKHKTINNISRTAIVDYQGSPLKIGEFLASIRKQHKLYLIGDNSRGSMSETSLQRYRILNSFSFDWEPGKTKQTELVENDVCMIFIEKYYKKNKTLEGIPETFTLDDKEYSIKNFFAHIRANHKKYESNENSKGSNSPTALRRYDTLDKMGFDWTPLETKITLYETDDKYMRYLEKYYQEHLSLENLPKIVIHDGIELNLENFLTDRRSKHKEKLTNPEYIPSQLELTRWKKLDEMHFDWTPRETQHQEKMTNDKYIKYLKYHYKEHGTINDITAGQEVEFEGETLKIGDFINDMRKKHLAYIEKKDVSAVNTELMLKRYNELDEMDFNWRPSESTITIAKIARTHGIKENKLRKYVARFNGDIDKAVKICKATAKYYKTTRKKVKSKSPSLTTIAQEFEINTEGLTALLNRPALQIKLPKKVLMYDKDTNLRQYCLDNGLNYTVIQKAIKLHMEGLSNEDLQTLINRCIYEYKSQGQQQPSTWIYSKYENEILANHLLTYLCLDSEAILYDMSINCVDIYQAIENNSFKRSCKQKYNYLEFIYRDVVKFYKITCDQETDKGIISELTIDYLQGLVKEYHLTAEEISIIKSSFDRYTNAVKKYKQFNVGFEKDPKKRIEKILEYKLDEAELEEAFFIPLEFDKKSLIGRDSEIYIRRALLKNITLRWGNLTGEDQQEIITQHNLSSKEIKYITTARKTIDDIKRKVYQKK